MKFFFARARAGVVAALPSAFPSSPPALSLSSPRLPHLVVVGGRQVGHQGPLPALDRHRARARGRRRVDKVANVDAVGLGGRLHRLGEGVVADAAHVGGGAGDLQHPLGDADGVLGGAAGHVLDALGGGELLNRGRRERGQGQGGWSERARRSPSLSLSLSSLSVSHLKHGRVLVLRQDLVGQLNLWVVGGTGGWGAHVDWRVRRDEPECIEKTAAQQKKKNAHAAARLLACAPFCASYQLAP